MTKRKADQPPEIKTDAQPLSVDCTPGPAIVTAELTVSEARPLEATVTAVDTSSSYVAGEDELESSPFWELLRLAGYEIW